ncbi:Scorpion toxin-like knottin superfamily protein [Prunus dulcis]|uniref:Scorpion toxin-like knottin superfamily protein n=1 Tax=Prunus dulcis TaxID=3755 RepID=A0A5H2XRB8_PRUDU|nr:Scorpion toxin-like knottin superfamily protein [Prunus dulcis]
MALSAIVSHGEEILHCACTFALHCLGFTRDGGAKRGKGLSVTEPWVPWTMHPPPQLCSRLQERRLLRWQMPRLSSPLLLHSPLLITGSSLINQVDRSYKKMRCMLYATSSR